jgi:transcriptional antiterminator NusG
MPDSDTADDTKNSIDNAGEMLEDNTEKSWYAIHTYSGYEDAVARNLRQRVDSMDMEDKIFDVIVPKKEVTKVKRGSRVEEEELIYPGYVLVQMEVTEDSWYVVRNTPRVTGFVGSGSHPDPLDASEVEELFAQMDEDSSEHEIDVSEGDPVRIIDGPFDEQEGTVDGVDPDRGKVKVLVSMFGRETPVELDFLQIEPL